MFPTNFWTALTMYPMIDSKMMRREPPPVAEFGPPTMKKFGSLGAARERYADA
jgi:hypothetical protein